MVDQRPNFKSSAFLAQDERQQPVAAARAPRSRVNRETNERLKRRFLSTKRVDNVTPRKLRARAAPSLFAGCASSLCGAEFAQRTRRRWFRVSVLATSCYRRQYKSTRVGEILFLKLNREPQRETKVVAVNYRMTRGQSAFRCQTSR